MIQACDITLQFGKRILFKDVNVKFSGGNCYGLIGANGAGKSTFLKVLTGEQEATSGEVIIDKGKRLAYLRQNHNEFDNYGVIETVIMGYKKLYDIMIEKDAIYEKPDFSDEDGIRASELETEFGELGGYEAENDAAKLLSGLGIPEDLHDKKMSELGGSEKVRVLIAQALFGNPDILLMDEPTNYLDIDSIKWLEEFLINFENTVVVVSHDRHFLNTVCTHIVDIDYGKLTFYAGNYDFWYESSQLLRKQLKDENKKKEERIAELKDFIRRFSSNAAKSKQATSRKKILDKINLEEMRPSSRKFPYIAFTPSRESGKEILSVEKINKVVDGVTLLKDVSFTVQKGEKIAIIGQDSIAKTMLFKILAGEEKADKGDITWGQTINYAYFPKDNAKFFDNVDLSLIDWLKQFSKNTEETYIRSFLGRMLFSGDESLKSAKVLSGGEKVRCMLSRMMLSEANFLMLDEATNHLDLESITALNNGLSAYKESMLFVSQDHQFISTIANRIIEITPKGIIDKSISYDDYLESAEIRDLQKEMYS